MSGAEKKYHNQEIRRLIRAVFFRLLLEDIPVKYLLGEDVSPRKSSERRRFAQKIFCQKILGRKTPPAEDACRRSFPFVRGLKKMRYKEMRFVVLASVYPISGRRQSHSWDSKSRQVFLYHFAHRHVAATNGMPYRNRDRRPM